MPPIEAQHLLDKIRPPRVQITYDVETGGAIQKVELPFVLGIMADLSGNNPNPVPPPPPLKERKFIEIDRDNFNQIMRAIAPALSGIQVERLIPREDGTQPAGEDMSISLTFAQMNDFNPASIVRQVPGLNDLMVKRQRLRDLLAKIEGNDALRTALVINVVAPPALPPGSG